MDYTIKNKHLKMTVSSIGAEISSIYDYELEKERIWQKDPKYWKRSSPLLFPIIGKLKEDEMYYKNKVYSMNSHGIMRDKKFELGEQTQDSLTFVYRSNETDYKIYPFRFSLEIQYRIDKRKVYVSWCVKNRGEETMYYAIGAHPAFNIDYKQTYHLEFPLNNKTNAWILKEGLLHKKIEKELKPTKIEPSFFENRDQVYESVDAVVLRSEQEQIYLNCPNFPILTIWSPIKDGEMAPFVCLEPWYGVPDVLDHDKNIENKFLIQKLAASTNEEYEYSFEFK